MSNTGDDGAWTPQDHDQNGAQGGAQDPWAQGAEGQWSPAPDSGTDPYGQASPYGAASPYGQASPYGVPSGQDPYGAGEGQGPFGAAGEGQDPYGAQSGQAPYGAADGQSPYGGQAPYGSADGQAPYGSAGGQAPYGGPTDPVQGEPQSRVLVGVLGIFLGGFGVHRFLLGYTTIGIIQIIVTVLTCGLGAWWGLIEGIMVLAKSPAFLRDAHGRPLKD